MHVQSNVALMTGGARGIGKAVAKGGVQILCEEMASLLSLLMELTLFTGLFMSTSLMACAHSPMEGGRPASLADGL